MSLERFFSKETWSTYRALAVAITCFTVAGAYLSAQHLNREKRLLTQQTTTEVAAAISSQVKGDIEHLVRSLTEIGETKLKPLYTKASEQPATRDGEVTSELEFDRDFLDVSMWRPGQNGAKPQRVYLALNHPYISPSQDTVLRSTATEGVEADLIGAAFRGQVVVTLAPTVDTGSVILMAIPMGQGTEGNDVVAAHIKLSRFQRAFRWEGNIRVVFVNADGFVIARTGFKLQDIRESLNNHPVVLALRSDSMTASGGEMDYVDAHGDNHIGGYRRISPGRLAVIASVPEAEVINRLSFFGGSVWLVAMLFGSAVAVGFVLSSGRGRSRVTTESATFERTPMRSEAHAEKTGFLQRLPRRFFQMGRKAVGAVAPLERADLKESGTGPVLALEKRPSEPVEPTIAGIARRRVVTVLHGSISQLSQILEASGTEGTVEALKEFLGLIEARVRDHGGKFAREPGSSFIAVWGAGEGPGDGDFRAVRCAIDLRVDLSHLNEARRTDGERPLALGMGIDSGLALAGTIDSEGGFGVVGEVLGGARKLGQLASSSGRDLFVAQEVWTPVFSRFVGEKIGETRFRNDHKDRAYYEVRGYLDEKGSEVIIVPSKTEPVRSEPLPEATPVPPPPSHVPVRWFVNNGTQVAGPWTPDEIGRRLFAQELDFDCECWAEGTNAVTPISASGMFNGSAEAIADATLWVFDGNTVHGPFNEGFLKTAVRRRAIGSDSQICEGSTIQGWRALQSWLITHPSAAEPGEVIDVSEPTDAATFSKPTETPTDTWPPAGTQEASVAAATEGPASVELATTGPDASTSGTESSGVLNSDDPDSIPPEDPESWRRAA